MDKINTYINEAGDLVIPHELAEDFGFVSGTLVRLDKQGNRLLLHRPVSKLNKVYVEVTDMCNLFCPMCIRNAWGENLGRMSAVTFERILDSVLRIQPVPTIFLGGMGEPLFHPEAINWITKAKNAGVKVEIITNGTILTPKISQRLIDCNLDKLWVSIDGASDEVYNDIRAGGNFSKVLDNLQTLKKMQIAQQKHLPEIGFAFVAMGKNIAELPKILKLGKDLGVSDISISNVLPYTKDLVDEGLYSRIVSEMRYLSSLPLPNIALPKMDYDKIPSDIFLNILFSGYGINRHGSNIFGSSDYCSFIEEGTTSIAWNGDVSPCWPLMHDYVNYLHSREHQSKKHTMGNVNNMNLLDIWLDDAYVKYRQKVQNLDFAPCTYCTGCELSVENIDDCFGNGFPACGSCSWYGGLIRCP